MLLRTDTLTENALEWAVAKALLPEGQEKAWLHDRQRGYEPCFSRLWSEGGWLLEECVANGMKIERTDPGCSLPKFKVSLDNWASVFRADELLVAVCRCYVAYRLGKEVEIPAEVLALPSKAALAAVLDSAAKASDTQKTGPQAGASALHAGAQKLQLGADA